MYYEWMCIQIPNLKFQAEPLFKDKRLFVKMVDPLLEDNFPMKGLFQALAVAAMCLQEEATTRPLMSDVVTALEYLTVPDNANSDYLDQLLNEDSSEP